ncbi:MAG TPA: hypothetical protein DCZ12_10330 [Gammaproteobacteria bacterium]|nr:hypothetical protein [Gammaproteobacteria bacterium]
MFAPTHKEFYMEGIDFTQLTQYAKAFTAFTPDKEKCLQDAANTVGQEVQQVTENFYAVLTSIDKTKPYLEGRVELLKQSHLHWLKSLFTGPYDEDWSA